MLARAELTAWNVIRLFFLGGRRMECVVTLTFFLEGKFTFLVVVLVLSTTPILAALFIVVSVPNI